jgi:hypothetical protein
MSARARDDRSGAGPPATRSWQSDYRVIGTGELGGKAQGLVRIARDVLADLSEDEFPDFSVRVPPFAVLGTDVFRQFVTANDLVDLGLSDLPDDRIAHAFQRANLPAHLLGELRRLVASAPGPLAVRSSSRLEDALEHPFAGVYATKMTPNNQPSPDERFKRVLEAIKFVYATTYFQSARSYLESIGRDPHDEQMAVVIQDVVGRAHGDRFYPAVSGVARSFNYYPSGAAKPHDGVVSLALGLGKQIVDGDACWTYVPAYPAAPPPFVDIGTRLDVGQKEFWAVNVGKPPLPDPVRETEYLIRGDLDDAHYDGVLDHVVSTYDAASDRLRPGLVGRGPRCVDFAPLLSLGTRPFNALVQRLLALSERALGGAVEIEFAAELTPDGDGRCRFGFLQLRPMAVADERVDVTADDLADPRRVVAAHHALGNGIRTDLVDIVYVKPDAFEAGRTPTVALEIAEHNRRLLAARRPYILIGFGRWGSADPWLGIPVDWGQVSGARVLVEASLPGMSPDVSQGSHFFHNLIGFRVLYLATGRGARDPVDWEWLAAQSAVAESRFVRHVVAPAPLRVAVDGLNGRGVIRHD